ncbi:copper resistance protein NlpE [Polaribacter sp. Asnod1-A03]|uniref:copper resistance protein NlpE n=1 Tax=Polaribacter sp. Asnod1-A03 TaxID=3160581 RepID=UPI003867F8ED
MKKIKKKLKVTIPVIVLFIFFACKSDAYKDVVGVYEGELPCGDCIGIDNKMTLKVDKTFVLETIYRGKGNGKIFRKTGKYSVENEQLILNVKKSPFKYQIGDDYIELLDIDGNKIESELNYKLIKQE